MKLFRRAGWIVLLLALPAEAALVDDPLHHAMLVRRAETTRPELPGLRSVAGNALVNGDFAASLSGWTATGDVQSVGSDAVLADTTAVPALLYQQADVTGGLYSLTFDYQSGLSSNAAPGSFPDTFFASLYVGSGTGGIDIVNGVFDDTLALLDLDAGGAFQVAGLIGPSVNGPDWRQFSYQFNLVYNQVAVAFELAGLNNIDGDSFMRIDNVAIVLVPEPASALLLVAGALLLVRRLRS